MCAGGGAYFSPVRNAGRGVASSAHLTSLIEFHKLGWLHERLVDAKNGLHKVFKSDVERVEDARNDLQKVFQSDVPPLVPRPDLKHHPHDQLTDPMTGPRCVPPVECCSVILPFVKT